MSPSYDDKHPRQFTTLLVSRQASSSAYHLVSPSPPGDQATGSSPDDLPSQMTSNRVNRLAQSADHQSRVSSRFPRLPRHPAAAASHKNTTPSPTWNLDAAQTSPRSRQGHAKTMPRLCQGYAKHRQVATRSRHGHTKLRQGHTLTAPRPRQGDAQMALAAGIRCGGGGGAARDGRGGSGTARDQSMYCASQRNPSP